MSSKLETLISSIKELPVIKQRAVAAIVGATVADAAARPLHWIYNQDNLDAVLKSAEQPEFYPENKCPFYSIPLGQNSCFNDILKCTLFYLDKNTGNVDMGALASAFNETFGDGTSYDKAYKARSSSKGPVCGPWLHGSLIKMLEDRKKGAPLNNPDSADYDGFLAALPLIIRHAGSPSLWEKVKKVTSLLTTNEKVQPLFHADLILLEECLRGSADPLSGMKEKLQELHPAVMQTLTELESSKEEPFISTVAKNGKACSLPGSFLGSYLAIVKTSSFVDAVRLNITAGGCNCSRGNMIGAYRGARYGIDDIPVDWMKRVNNIEQVLEAALNVARQ